MHIRDIAKRSLRGLRAAKVRTLLTAMAIGVGGFTLTITLAAGNGIRDYADTIVSSNFDPSELLVGRDSEVSNTGAPSDKPKEFDDSVSSINLGDGSSSLQVKQVTQQDIDELEANPNIEEVRRPYQIAIRYVTREGQKQYTGGVEVYNAAQKPELAAGELPVGGDIESGEVLLPESYISVLGFSSAADAIGKTIKIVAEKPFSAQSLQVIATDAEAGLTINPESVSTEPEQVTKELTIRAISKRPVASLAFGVMPLYISNQDARSLYDFTALGTPNYDKFIFVYARVKSGSNPDQIQRVKQELESAGYFVQSSAGIQDTLNQFVNVLQTMVAVFGVITLIASVFGVINTQYISVLERTREIGLMKALGMSGKDVSRLFTIEAMWIGFLGGLIGAVVALLIGLLLNPLITNALELGEGNDLLVFDVVQIALLIVALVAVAAVAGLLPARKAAKLDPITALRTE